MSRPDLEDLLWQLADHRPEDHPAETDEDGARPVPDAVLDAYRQGRLETAEERRVEQLLAQDEEARQRLIRRADLAPPAGLERVRRRLLAATGPTEATVPTESGHEPRQRHRRAGWLAAAALVAASLGLGLWVSQPDLPPLPEVSAHIQGPAALRNGGAEAGGDGATAPSALRVTADEPVTVALHVEPARAGIAVALFAHDREAGVLRRLAVPAAWKDRGTAVFQAPARELVGERPGAHPLYAVAAWEDRLPSSRPLAAGESPTTALAGPFVHVSPLTLEILPDLPSDASDVPFSSTDLSEKEARSP